MNFSKEYIREADCKEIQGLKREMLDGDWLVNREFYDTGAITWEGHIKPKLLVWDKIIWLPTGDQLDDEIVKICEKTHDYDYELSFWASPETWDCKITEECTGEVIFVEDAYHENILEAKIKLLKALLE